MQTIQEIFNILKERLKEYDCDYSLNYSTLGVVSGKVNWYYYVSLNRYDFDIIINPKYDRKISTLCHEFAHIIAILHRNDFGHSWYMARQYAKLCREFNIERHYGWL